MFVKIIAMTRKNKKVTRNQSSDGKLSGTSIMIFTQSTKKFRNLLFLKKIQIFYLLLTDRKIEKCSLKEKIVFIKSEKRN